MKVDEQNVPWLGLERYGTLWMVVLLWNAFHRVLTIITRKKHMACLNVSVKKWPHYAILSSNIIVCLQRTCLKEFSLNETIDTLRIFVHTKYFRWSVWKEVPTKFQCLKIKWAVLLLLIPKAAKEKTWCVAKLLVQNAFRFSSPHIFVPDDNSLNKRYLILH